MGPLFSSKREAAKPWNLNMTQSSVQHAQKFSSNRAATSVIKCHTACLRAVDVCLLLVTHAAYLWVTPVRDRHLYVHVQGHAGLNNFLVWHVSA